MSEASIVLPTFGPQEWKILWFVLVSAFIALGYGAYLARKTIQEDPGSQAMQDVAKAIEEGALAYLARQVKTMIWFVIAITIGLFFMYRGVYEGMLLPLGVSLAFFMGVAASYGAGYVGMWLAVKGNVRTAAAALHSFKSSLEIAFRAGTVSGMFTVGLGLLGATIIFLLFKENAMKILIGFGFGGSLAALFMRMGGGIFTKAADVGADLVGKVEKGIPEDDPRNPATIADNVGDNVGDCAGMAADVFESYEVTLVAAIILGAGAMLDKDFVESFGGAASASKVVLALVIYPLLIRAVGVFGSIFGTWCVRGKDDPAMNPMKPITFGFWMAALSSIVGFWIVSYFYLGDIVSPKYGAIWWRVFLANVMGIGLALVIEWLTGYFTAVEKKPVTEIAYASRTGPATLILSGIASGLESSVWAVLAIVATIYGSYSIFGASYSLSAYGIALAGLGLLATTGFILAEDTFGPISDNANGIFEMSGALKNNPRTPSGIEAHRIVAKLDAVGNTTKALTKGLAIATAVLAAVALFRSFIDEAHLIGAGIQVNLPEVFIGLLIGGAVPFLFSSFAIQAVSRAAFLLVEEVRRQFREKPGIMEFKEKPDYGRCVEIVTAAAQKELIGPAILSIVSPILVAFAFGAAALGGFLAGAILTGQLMAVFLSNTGGAWDNAKKKIEEGLFGGKGTDCHKAAVIGDTVGDPFKDTAGPAINPMIKVMNLVAILIAPLAIRDIGGGTRFLIFLACVVVLGISVAFSKRGSIVTEEPTEAVKAEARKAH
ncbi:MAG: sodium-translocating pyrophosphatase [candidate division NC10 bacterium]|nr:sodium-translocating pyrophosphatase [candidate division NC10 bacterium]